MSDTSPPAIDATILGYARSVVTSLVTSALMGVGAFLAAHGIRIPDPTQAETTAIAGGVLLALGAAYKAVKSYLDHKAKVVLAEAPATEVKK